MTDERYTLEDTPEVRQALSDAADFLLPLASACCQNSPKWPIEVVSWLTMIKYTMDQTPATDRH